MWSTRIGGPRPRFIFSGFAPWQTTASHATTVTARSLAPAARCRLPGPHPALHGHRRADSKSARRSAQSQQTRIVMSRPSGGVPWTSLIVGMTGRIRSRLRGAASCSAMSRRANGSRHRDDVSTRRDDGADRGPDVCGEPSDSWVITVPSRPTLPALTIGSNLPLMVGAVIYVRVSTKEQTENLSLRPNSVPARSTAVAKATTSSNVSTKKARARRPRTAVSSRHC
jgi:hypothetical protein